MTTDLDDLLARTAARPSAAIDPDEVRTASRRRTARRRAIGGSAGLAVAAAVAVAVPLLVGDPTPVIDDVAGPEDGAVVTLDLPDGWTQVAVGDAVFGVPDRVEVRGVAADDTAPCPNTDRVSTAHVAPDGWADGGGCDAPGPAVTSLVARPAGDQRPDVEELIGEELVIEELIGEEVATRDEVTVADRPATRVTYDLGDDWGPDRTYVVPSLDLRLTFTALAYDPQLEADVLATVAPASGPAADGDLPGDVPYEAHDGPQVERDDPVEDDAPEDAPTDHDDTSGDAPTDDDAPDAGTEVAVGQITMTAPDGVEVSAGGSQLPCHLAAQVAVLDALTPEPGPECPAAGPGGTLVALVPAERVAPAFRPGEGDADGSRQVEEVELLGTAGTRETWTDANGFEAQSWWFPDLDLHVEVRGAELTPNLVDDLLASVARR